MQALAQGGVRISAAQARVRESDGGSDVADLCKGFRARLEEVVEKEGDAIGK